MKLSLPLTVLASALAFSLAAQGPMPRLQSVEPATGKAGDTLSASGEHLQKDNVAELYLTDGKNDLKLPITDQNPTTIKFTLPKTVKAGRFALMILTAGKDPKLIEQPVKVTVE